MIWEKIEHSVSFVELAMQSIVWLEIYGGRWLCMVGKED
jgi:hypothetical protein